MLCKNVASLKIVKTHLKLKWHIFTKLNIYYFIFIINKKSAIHYLRKFTGQVSLHTIVKIVKKGDVKNKVLFVRCNYGGGGGGVQEFTLKLKSTVDVIQFEIC